MANLPPVDPLWRPNTTTAAPNDLVLIRTWLGWPATDASLTELIQAMNTLAGLSPPDVSQVQAWIDEVLELETTQAAAVADGTAHLGNATEYEGPIPGTTPTREEQLQQADVLQWDTSLLKARYGFSGGGPGATAQGQREQRMQGLITRIAQTLNTQRYVSPWAMGGMLQRS